MEDRGIDGYAPIHIAIKQNDHKLVKVLLRDYCKCLSLGVLSRAHAGPKSGLKSGSSQSTCTCER